MHYMSIFSIRCPVDIFEKYYQAKVMVGVFGRRVVHGSLKLSNLALATRHDREID